MSDIIGIGTDITECLRIARMIERHGELFIDRVYTAEETEYCQSRKQGDAAFHRALGGEGGHAQGHRHGLAAGNFVRDMEIRNEPIGRPVVAVRGGVQEVVERLGISEIRVSISHCHTHATAVAIAVGVKKEEPEIV